MHPVLILLGPLYFFKRAGNLGRRISLFKLDTNDGHARSIGIKCGLRLLAHGIFHPLTAFAAREGARFAVAGTAYRTAPLGCTLLACRAAGCRDAWLVLTDLPVAAADPCWYALRSWVEQGFKVIKSGGWQWQRARIAHPDRAERVWAALAVATLWPVEVDGLAEFEPRAETVPPFRPPAGPRTHRLFRVGLGLILAGLMAGEVRSGRFAPEPWPNTVPIPAVTEDEFMAQSTYP